MLIVILSITPEIVGVIPVNLDVGHQRGYRRRRRRHGCAVGNSIDRLSTPSSDF